MNHLNAAHTLFFPREYIAKLTSAIHCAPNEAVHIGCHVGASVGDSSGWATLAVDDVSKADHSLHLISTGRVWRSLRASRVSRTSIASHPRG